MYKTKRQVKIKVQEQKCSILNPALCLIQLTLLKKTGEKVELYEPFPNDLGKVCVLTNHQTHYKGHLYCLPEELEVIK